MSELKPCPFCGLPANSEHVTRIMRTDYAVGCYNPTCKVNPKSVDSSEEEAIAIWNTRPGEAAAFPSFEEWKKKAIPDPVALSWVEMGLIEEAWAAAVAETKRRAVEILENDVFTYVHRRATIEKIKDLSGLKP